MTKKEEEIQNLTNQIVKKYHPEKVILFGSCIHGNRKESSDIDIAIIKRTEDKFTKRIKKLAKLVKSWQALDILVYTPQEWNKALSQGNYFIKEISNTGKVVYEK